MPFRRGQLRYFVAVAEEGQITSAARKLHLAQPALSQAIAQLEGELGFKLLQRHARGVTLTEAGRAFYEKARSAVDAAADASQTASALARAQARTIEFGFVGAPPGLDSPAPLEAFARAHPDIDLRFRELPFPSSPTGTWLADVDVAVCHAPLRASDVWIEPLRREPRVVLAPTRHRLSQQAELTPADVSDETYIGFHPSVESAWAGFWSLDDHRGGPPTCVTEDRVTNAQEVLAALAVRTAITTVPASVAGVIVNVLTGVVAVPLRDCEPSTIALVGLSDRHSGPVSTLLTFAREYAAEARREPTERRSMRTPGAQRWTMR
jgi:DNA-binding transcriptional LysR family regulator